MGGGRGGSRGGDGWGVEVTIEVAGDRVELGRMNMVAPGWRDKGLGFGGQRLRRGRPTGVVADFD